MAKIVYLRTDKTVLSIMLITLALDVEELEDLIDGLIQAGLVTSVEELEKDLLQLLKKNILQSIELSWMREPEREQRLRGLSR